VPVGTSDTIAVTATFMPDPGFDSAIWTPGSVSAPFSVQIPTSPGANCVVSLTCLLDISFSPTTIGSFSGVLDLQADNFNTMTGLPGGIVHTDLTLSGSATAPATPLPAGLPLFASGLGALGLLGWRRKRKARAV
jgi:hypothetical protein